MITGGERLASPSGLIGVHAHSHGSDSAVEYACDCGDVSDTLDGLKAHAKEQRPTVYVETFAD